MSTEWHSPYPALPPPRQVALVTPPARPCPYLPDREAKIRAFFAGRMNGELYHEFMDAGFRRAGRIVYQPICAGCRACMPIRVAVEKFAPNKSLRRCSRRNNDLKVQVGQPALDEERYELYRRYLISRHDGQQSEDQQSLEDFLYSSPVPTVEFTYRDQSGKLLAVGICDLCTKSLSSVYFYFDPAESARGLGNFGALVEIAYARRSKIPYWYIGYWVKGCRAMEYKANFRPHELLHPDGVWREG
jgi:arginine-tRNA-protein transferase